MPDLPLLIDGVAVPRFLYGTAWKEDDTQRLVELALAQGFRGIDTANQRKHYHEAAVGQAIQACRDRIPRSELFLQTKFTFQRGQDHRLPYDPAAPIGEQVRQSFASSLEHLGTDVIDSYVLHGPSQSSGLTAADWSAWRAMETLHDNGWARLLGVSNVSLSQLQTLCREARVPPRFVQNRCYADRRWNRDIREYCSARGMVYQGFSPHGKSCRANPPCPDPHCRASRTDRQPDHLPICHGCRNAASHGYHGREPYAGRFGS